jgi:hypothetical protein
MTNTYFIILCSDTCSKIIFATIYFSFHALLITLKNREISETDGNGNKINIEHHYYLGTRGYSKQKAQESGQAIL